MKALIVVEDDAVADAVRYYLQPLGLDVIRYRDPLKALDNLDEICPDAVIMSGRDFPRHWKTIVVNLRASRPKSACAILLLKGDYFPFEEAAKAAYLGVNAVIKEDLTDKSEFDRFQQVLKRYIDIDDSRVSDRLSPKQWDRIGFAFSHPVTYVPITGTVEAFSNSGLSFLPESTALVADIEPGTMLDDASLRVGDTILSIRCRVVRNRPVMAFSFECGKYELQTIDDYIAGRSDREIHALLKH